MYGSKRKRAAVVCMCRRERYIRGIWCVYSTLVTVRNSLPVPHAISVFFRFSFAPYILTRTYCRRAHLIRLDRRRASPLSRCVPLVRCPLPCHSHVTNDRARRGIRSGALGLGCPGCGGLMGRGGERPRDMPAARGRRGCPEPCLPPPPIFPSIVRAVPPLHPCLLHVEAHAAVLVRLSPL
ncbi:hypothetical protein C8R47DRAFT_1159501 [Mycena vitilis]|nr:hypothetical protein C8R47DRAFT_1159501 [Mycena vitilis]